ncbi:MAG: hypothetical protein ACF8XB_03645 [Planctomycetota bacterium JB042]
MTAESTLDRRRWLKDALGLAAAAALPRCATAPPPPPPGRPERLVLIRFGAGVRPGDLFTDDRKSSLAPGLWTRAREGALARTVRNEGSTGHREATRVLVTGRGGDDLATLRGHPTVFELWRAAHGRPREAAFVAGLPEASDAPGFGSDAGALTYVSEHAPRPGSSISGDPTLGPAPLVDVANDFLAGIVPSLDERRLPPSGPPRLKLLRGAIDRGVPAPLKAGELGQQTIDALTDRLMNGRPYVASDEADDWLTELSIRAVSSLKPDLIGLGWSTTDLAHRGAWTTYARQVRRLDLLLDRLCRFLESDPFYRGRTLVLVTVDCGRGDERFDRHDADRPGARETFLVAFGAGAARRRLVETPLAQVDVAATVARALDFDLPNRDGRPAEELLA